MPINYRNTPDDASAKAEKKNVRTQTQYLVQTSAACRHYCNTLHDSQKLQNALLDGSAISAANTICQHRIRTPLSTRLKNCRCFPAHAEPYPTVSPQALTKPFCSLKRQKKQTNACQKNSFLPTARQRYFTGALLRQVPPSPNSDFFIGPLVSTPQ